MEELTEGGNTYSQTKMLSEKSGCMGCVFDDIEDGCMAGLKFYNLCTINKTIWIKKEQEMEEYTDKDGIVYKQGPEGGNNCTGCAFNNHGRWDCEASQVIKSCGTGKIIWVKKAQEMNAEVTEDCTEPKYVAKAGVKYDQEKERYDLVPVLALEEVAKVLTAGATKYNEDYEEENWRKVPNATRRYFSATQRHLAKVRKGETHDIETNLHHYAHAITNLMFLLEKELENKVPTKD